MTLLDPNDLAEGDTIMLHIPCIVKYVHGGGEAIALNGVTAPQPDGSNINDVYAIDVVVDSDDTPDMIVGIPLQDSPVTVEHRTRIPLSVASFG